MGSGLDLCLAVTPVQKPQGQQTAGSGLDLCHRENSRPDPIRSIPVRIPVRDPIPSQAALANFLNRFF